MKTKPAQVVMVVEKPKPKPYIKKEKASSAPAQAAKKNESIIAVEVPPQLSVATKPVLNVDECDWEDLY